MAVPTELLQLVDRFHRNIDAYKSGAYNETQVRREFIDPLFKLLGWDTDNTQGYAEAYKDVVHEDAVKIGGATKAPDYCFRVGGTRKFFLEAKKPSVNIREDESPAFQLRRYAWSAKLPLSVLTDFEELAVYDCRVKPVKTDKASTGRTLYLKYTDYPARWEELVSVFSREAVLKGSFDKYAESTKAKKGTAEVDAAFLREIESWRDSLAKTLALRNPALTQRDLNFAVQRIIDRIIFLRICEDRGMEDYGRLMALQNGSDVYKRLCHLFQEADNRYNSGLFHFRRSKDRPTPPDDLTLNLFVDDKVLKDIFKNLYYPESPYEFSVLPSDILGQVYEQFLGKVIRLTSGHRALVEDKPEVKKAGGVFYTPTYIVDYIVKETVGKLLEGKKPGPKGSASRIKILDPACGSGSFLIGAYQYLLDWYRVRYLESGPEKHKKEIYQAQGGEWRLTTAEKKRILLANIYGVDIDAQAVETTKLSLLLKVLEGESGETITKQWKLLHERALPDLGNNIKCGNSLIGPDFYDGRQLDFFDDEERHRVNVFDWTAEFPEIMKDGGFDAVIGNPPYVQLSMMEYYNRVINDYLIRNYTSSMGRLNTFGLFIERSIKILLRKNGFMSYIIPNSVLTQEYYKELRQEMLRHDLINITTYDYAVFANAVVETVVFVLRNTLTPINKVQILRCNNKMMLYTSRLVEQKIYEDTHQNAFLVGVGADALAFRAKIEREHCSLKNIANINQAIALKHDRNKSLFQQKKTSNFKPVLDGRNIQRYALRWDGYYLAYDIRNIHSCKRTDIFETDEKIFFRRVGDRLIATYDSQQYYALNTLVVITLKNSIQASLKYLLGLINSRLLNFYYVTFLKSTKKVFSEIQARQLAQIPIRTIDFSDPSDKARHDRMVLLVDRMLDLNKELQKAKTAHDQTVLQRQIGATDKEIDRLVYDLYGLAEEEIKIVEGTGE